MRLVAVSENKDTLSGDRLFAVMCAINELVIKIDNESFLFSKACEALVKIANYKMAWIGRVVDDDKKSIKPIAYYGNEDKHLENIDLMWDGVPGKLGSCGDAVKEKRIIIINNIGLDDAFMPLHDNAIEREYNSVSSIPIIINEKISHVLLLYSSEINFFDNEEINLLEHLVGILAFGLGKIKDQEELEILHNQLQQAQKMESIGQLTGGMAHDFNNILGSVLGFNTLAQKRLVVEEDHKLQEYLREIQLAGERARDQVAKMLAFSRVKPGEKVELDMAIVVREVVKMMKATIPSSIEIVTDIEPALPSLLGDGVQLQQSLVNLILNSRDAMKNNKGCITVSLKMENIFTNNTCSSCNEKYGGKYVVLAVSDDGVGITELELERIFEPFYSTKESGKSTGMGLPMVHGIVHDMDGHIRIEKGSEGGVIMSILLPPYVVSKKIISRKLH